MVVEHEDAINERAHIWFIGDFPITKRCGISANIANKINSSQIPIIEVKADSSTYVVGPLSLHKTDYKYQIKGTDKIKILDKKGLLLYWNKLWKKSIKNTNQITNLREMLRCYLQ